MSNEAALLECTEKYRERESLFKQVRFTRPEAHASDASQLEILSVRLRTLTHDTYFVQLVCDAKIFKLTQWLDWSIKMGNTVALASGVRALLEHVAVWNEVNRTLARCLDGLKNQSSPDKVEKSLLQVENILKRAYYGTSSGDEGTKRLHVNHSIKLLDSSAGGGAQELYDFLCDYVHPNYGSNRLVSSGALGEGGISVDAPPIELGNFPDKCSLIACVCFDFFLVEEHQLTMNLRRLRDYAERCTSTGAKIQNVFTVKLASPKGDGNTLETAFTFPKARTHLEEQEMVHQYLESKGIFPRKDGTIQNLVSLKPLREYWDTPQGKIFFAYRHRPIIQQRDRDMFSGKQGTLTFPTS